MTKRITWSLVLLATLAAAGMSACQQKGDNKASMNQTSTPSSEAKSETPAASGMAEQPSDKSTGESAGKDKKDNMSN